MPEARSDSGGRGQSQFAQDFRQFFFRGLALILPPVLTVWILFQLWVFIYDYVGQPFNLGVRYVIAFAINEGRWEVPPAERGLWEPLREGGPYVPARVYRTVAQHSVGVERMPQSVLKLYERYIYYKYYLPWHLSFTGLLVAAVVVYFIGRFLASFIGRVIWQGAEQTVFRLPVVRAVYPYVKQFIDFLLSDKKIEYNRVVAVEYPRRGVWSMGLVTGEALNDLEEAKQQQLLTVFIPFTPTPMTGHAITVPRSEVLDLNVTVDEAIRYIVSGGVVRPQLEVDARPVLPWVRRGGKGAGERAGPGRRRGLLGRSGVVRVGTRGSRLARAQTEWVVARLRDLAPHRRLDIVEIRTRGDRASETKLSQLGGEGVFTKELQRALLAGEIDVAVHSLKDLPTAAVPGLALAAVPGRCSPLDVLVAPGYGDWRQLPHGARVGTGSPRRRSQLLRLRPDLLIEPLRGNVPTRLEKLEREGLAAVVLAHAGLRRLGLERHITYFFPPEELLPAPGQGALAVECRQDDEELARWLAALDDPATRQAVTAERAVLQGLGGGCQVPVGTLATVSDELLTVRAGVFDPDGSRHWLASQVGPATEPEQIGRAVAERLLADGAAAVVHAAQQLDQ